MWNKKSTKDLGGWTICEETITLDTSATDQSSSVIDFIPYGKDWWLKALQSATLATDADIDIDICENQEGTYWEMATTGITVSKSVTNHTDVIDNSAKGNAPYYKLRLDKSAAMTAVAGKTVKFTVMIPPENGVIY